MRLRSERSDILVQKNPYECNINTNEIYKNGYIDSQKAIKIK